MSESLATISGWEKALMAAERVKQRCLRAARSLDAAGIPYCVVGGNAVAEWVARVDEGAVRNTRDVDLLVRRTDFPAIRAALEAAGFVYQSLLDIDTFFDGPQGRASEALHLMYAGETIRPGFEPVFPDVSESERAAEFQVVSLSALVRMKLLAWRRKDQVHLLDMIAIGLIDASWPSRLSPPCDTRLQQLLDDPNG